MAKGKELQLGLHSYSLHLWGFGETWGLGRDFAFDHLMTLEDLMDKAVEWGLDGLHITNVDLISLDPENLAKVKKMAEDHDLYLEYNVSIDAPYDSRVNSTVHDALVHGKEIGADLVKFSIDIVRPRPYFGTKFHPDVMRQLCDRYDEFKKNIPLMEELGLEIAIENHCDLFSDEVIWLVKQLNHPKIGCCYDTINCVPVLEDPYTCMVNMAPYANCCHFCDSEMTHDDDGTHWISKTLGQGDMDCKMIYEYLKENAPNLRRITMEVEYETGKDTVEEARPKEMQSTIDSIKYLRDVVGIGLRGR